MLWCSRNSDDMMVEEIEERDSRSDWRMRWSTMLEVDVECSNRVVVFRKEAKPIFATMAS